LKCCRENYSNAKLQGVLHLRMLRPKSALLSILVSSCRFRESIFKISTRTPFASHHSEGELLPPLQAQE
jgi:hypothetical protein